MEVLRRPFRNGEPAQALRHTARDILLQAAASTPDPEWIDDALIVISELIQNVAQHTHCGGELVITIEPGSIMVEVGDTNTAVPHIRHPSPSQTGGRGLLLIEALSHDWGVHTCPAGKIVWVKMTTGTDNTSFSTT